jgi:hypothetical protein
MTSDESCPDCWNVAPHCGFLENSTEGHPEEATFDAGPERKDVKLDLVVDKK